MLLFPTSMRPQILIRLSLLEKNAYTFYFLWLFIFLFARVTQGDFIFELFIKITECVLAFAFSFFIRVKIMPLVLFCFVFFVCYKIYHDLFSSRVEHYLILICSQQFECLSPCANSYHVALSWLCFPSLPHGLQDPSDLSLLPLALQAWCQEEL
ncbi:unnamed protein product [Moneuplotes crassus]|uniref:Uncharacterized protein n=1 Tax=Euplotes crassus TaxID=5936 RepID=A0AAD1U9N8_EUPCR|nr:unnamed protein product [Moneuplotes crassus]